MTTLSVLIVDDEPGMRLGAERTLKDYIFTLPEFNEDISFVTKTAENGTEALRIVNEAAPDILILDYKLPDIHGLDILSRVLQEKKNLLAIMITAYASLEIAINATKNGAFDFLAKPFTPEELRNTVRKAGEHIWLERKAQRLEEEKRQVRFQFISVLAHELKSPLAAVENYLQIMKNHISGSDISQYEHMIGRSIMRIDGMRKLIVDLLDLTHIESGQKTRVFSEIHMKTLAFDVIEAAGPLRTEKRVAIKLECSDELMMKADKGELEILLTNILTNSIKYNKDDGHVMFAFKKTENGILITCEDTGIGMTEEEVSGIFKEFTRIKNEKTKNIVGSGLGLSIVKKIVDLYNGTVAVKSVPDSGTTITILIPDVKE